MPRSLEVVGAECRRIGLRIHIGVRNLRLSSPCRREMRAQFDPARVAATAVGVSKKPAERIAGGQRVFEPNHFLQVGPEERAAHLQFRVE